MADLIVENGNVVAGADAYVDAVFATTYHADRGNAAWALADAGTQNAAIRQATVFLDMRYLNRWKGRKLQPLQSRQFPRFGIRIDANRTFSAETQDIAPFIGLIPSNIVPDQIKHATCELALRALKGPLAPDLKRGGKITSKTIGPISTSYAADASPHTVYDFVELLIGDFLATQGTCMIVRA